MISAEEKDPRGEELQDEAAGAPEVVAEPGMTWRFWERLKNGDPSRTGTDRLEVASKDRTQRMALVAGGVVVVVIAGIGFVSTERRALQHTKPNLGRPLQQAAAQNLGSIAPLMSAQPQPEETDSDLGPQDVANTARPRRAEPEQAVPTVAAPVPPPRRDYALHQVPYSDPTAEEAYWRQQMQNRPPAPPPPVAPKPNQEAEQARQEHEGLRKASMVFVRQGNGSENALKAAGTRPAPLERVEGEFLPAGARLVARLESAVTSAVKTPAIAVIEYHYERDGEIVVPAGTRAIGELQQASAGGIVALRFHTLDFGDGREEPIDGAAIELDHGPLKGQVSGTNRGKRILARTLTGMGTLAAFMVGGGGYRLGGPLDNSVFLRERVAQNVGMAGEQELMSLAYGRNVVVTVPGNKRFYLVLERQAGRRAGISVKPAGDPRSSSPGLQLAQLDNGSPLPTAAELRELAALKRELTHLYLRAPVAKTVDPEPAR